MTTTPDQRKQDRSGGLPTMTTILQDVGTRSLYLGEHREPALVTYTLVIMTSAQRK